MNKRSNPCPKCAPFVGKVIVDDVWSGGTAEEAKEKGYLLMSDCIKQGLYHPNCQDSHTTYFGDIDDEEDEENTEEQEQTEEETKEETPETEIEENEVKQDNPTEEPKYPTEEKRVDSTVPTSKQQITPREQIVNEQLYDAEQRQNYCERQVQRFERMGKYSLDKDNQRIYQARKSEWKEKLAQVKESVQNFKKSIAKSAESGIIKDSKDIFQPVTNKSYELVSLLNVFNDERDEKIVSSMKRVLDNVKNKEIGTESLALFFLNDISLIDETISNSADGSVKKINHNEPFISIHNHPSGETISFGDIAIFQEQRQCKVMYVVGNNGNCYALIKTPKYNDMGFFELIMKRKLGFSSYSSEKEFLKECEKYGIKYIERTH